MNFRMFSVSLVVAGLTFSGAALAAGSDNQSQPLTADEIAQLSTLDQGQFDAIVAGGMASNYVQQFIEERAAKSLEGGGGGQTN